MSVEELKVLNDLRRSKVTEIEYIKACENGATLIDRLLARVASAEADARRYRWLRNPARMHDITIEKWGVERAMLHSEFADAYIDAAMESR